MERTRTKIEVKKANVPVGKLSTFPVNIISEGVEHRYIEIRYI